MTMRRLEYTVTFHTPAFLGNAEQSGQWRTPPFKALLRQWWRVAYAADNEFNVDVSTMRREEGCLFGHAWLKDDRENGRAVAARKSLLRLRLDQWKEGGLKKQQWPQDATISHPEVKNRQGTVGSALYLGFGPLEYDNQRKKTALKANAAIQAGESATLSIAIPEEHAPRLERALWLMDRYGTIGGRSRNGWGSFALEPLESTLPLSQAPAAFQRPWHEALELDWPHAIGKDENGTLIWQTSTYDDWKTLMQELAKLKIDLRTQKPQFMLMLNQSAGDKETPRGINHGAPQARHWLSYPVTNHSVRPWDAEFVNGKKKPLNLRLPNQLRFKVRQTQEGKLVGVIFHVPCKPPTAFEPKPSVIEDVWRKVHTFLDEQRQKLARIPE